MKQIKQDLEGLHQAINHELPADECTAASLKQVAQEIHLALETGHSPQADFNQQLETELLAFSEEHPRVAQAIRNLINTLSGMGV
ncbi:DUF4404 family protein [Motilimonas pumila]|nr:DUF4404 family protein [Motilimonas pumila]